MIFVTVGTTDFDDLLRAMDALAPTLGEEVVAQTGRGPISPPSAGFAIRPRPTAPKASV